MSKGDSEYVRGMRDERLRIIGICMVKADEKKRAVRNSHYDENYLDGAETMLRALAAELSRQ